MQNAYLCVIFYVKHKKLLFLAVLTWFLIFGKIQDGGQDGLIDLIAIKEQPRYNLRSASGLIFKYPSLKLKKTLGDRAFSSAATNLWNNLPRHIRLEDNFERLKSLLITHILD